MRFELESLPPWLGGGKRGKDWRRFVGRAESMRIRDENPKARLKRARVKRRVMWMVAGRRDVKRALESHGAA
jgi:hypothetical protein